MDVFNHFLKKTIKNDVKKYRFIIYLEYLTVLGFVIVSLFMNLNL